MTDGTSTSTITSISYDGGSRTARSGQREWDTAYASVTARGNPTSVTDNSGTKTISYDELGNPASVTVNGVAQSIATTTTTNFAAPEQLTVGSLTTTNTYSTFLGLTNETGPNSASISVAYDLQARPLTTTGVYGATTTNTYNDTASPPTFVATINGRWTRQTLDGLGRTVLIETGDANGTKSRAETVYDSCGCSPFWENDAAGVCARSRNYGCVYHIRVRRHRAHANGNGRRIGYDGDQDLLVSRQHDHGDGCSGQVEEVHP
ncbi:MAG: hypothetical protein JO307_05420 [Bryobacterales bacterium]|nr:hypothetical protein [Bryobacterales bacterium]